MKRLLWLLLVLALAGGAAKYFWPVEKAEVKAPVQTVTTFVVAQRDFPVLVESTGSTVASNIVDVRPQVTNVVAKVHIKEGQRVKAGDVLFTLDDRADRANFEKAKAASDDAQRQLERSIELLRQNFISQGSVDTARANAQSLLAAANAAQAALSYDTIRSPITGRAGIINVFPGALVQPGNTVSTTTTATATTAQGAMVTITQLDPINVQFTVPESALGSLFAMQQSGQAPTVSFEATGGQKRQGKVYVIDNQVDAAIGAVKVKAEASNADHALIPGQFVRVRLNAGSIKDALVIPSQAVVANTRGEQVFVVDAENTVELKPIKVLTQGQGFAVITGLNVGDKVVVEGKQNLRPKAKVRDAAAAKSEAKPEAKPQANPEAPSAPKTDAKPDVKAEAQK